MIRSMRAGATEFTAKCNKISFHFIYVMFVNDTDVYIVHFIRFVFAFEIIAAEETKI